MDRALVYLLQLVELGPLQVPPAFPLIPSRPLVDLSHPRSEYEVCYSMNETVMKLTGQAAPSEADIAAFPTDSIPSNWSLCSANTTSPVKEFWE